MTSFARTSLFIVLAILGTAWGCEPLSPEDRSAPPAPAEPSLAATGSAALAVEPVQVEQFSPPRTASLEPLPEGNPKVIRVDLDGIYVDGQLFAPLRGGGGERTEEAERWRDAISERLHRLGTESGADRRTSGGADEGSGVVTAVVLAIDQRIPVQTVQDLIEASRMAGLSPHLSAIGPDGQPHSVPFTPPEQEQSSWPERERPDHQPVADRPGITRSVPATGIQGGPTEEPESLLQRPDLSSRARRRFARPDILVTPRRTGESGGLPIQLFVQPDGIGLQAGTQQQVIRGIPSAEFPRDRRFPLIQATETWSTGTDLAVWVDWAAVQEQLVSIRDLASGRGTAIEVEVGVDPGMTYAVLVRLIDLVRYRVPANAAQGDPHRFEAVLLSGEGLEPLLPAPSLVYLAQISPPVSQERTGRPGNSSPRAMVFLDESLGVVAAETGERLALDTPYGLEILRSVSHHRNQARRCYRRMLDHLDVGVEGQVTLQVTLNGDGTVAEQQIIQNTLDEAAGECASLDLSSIQFPASPDGSTVAIQYRFQFILGR